MPTSLQYLEDVASSIYNNIPLEKVNRFISLAQKEISKSWFSELDTYNLAVAYLAAHYLQLSITDGSSRGALLSEKEGDLERRYGGSSSTQEPNTTQYYTNYQRLLENRIPIFYINGLQ